MITAQDIREKSFDKATFGGYDMSQVDDYLDELSESANATQKEIGSLRGKMKVLVDKIEEYRANEEAMRMALLSAQKLALQIEAEAQEKADAILAEAREKAEAILADAEAQRDAITGDLVNIRSMEERRLEAAREASASYFQKLFANLDRQKEFLCAIESMGVEEKSAGAEEETVAYVEEAVLYEDVSTPEAEEAFEEVPAAVAEEAVCELGEEVPAEPAVPEADEEVDEPTRMFRF